MKQSVLSDSSTMLLPDGCIYDTVHCSVWSREQVDSILNECDDEYSRKRLRNAHRENVAAAIREGSDYITSVNDRILIGKQQKYIEQEEAMAKGQKFAPNEIVTVADATTVKDEEIDAALSEVKDMNLLRTLALFYVHSASGQPHDKARGVRMLQKAAENGCTSAWYDLCLAYRYGEGVEVNRQQALKFHEKGAEAGHEIATFELGLGVDDGHLEGEEDADKAFLCYKTLLDNGYKCSKMKLGICHIRGHGCDFDVQRGVALIKEACDDGNYVAMYAMAKLHKFGLGAPQDQRGELHYLQRSAEAGYGKAMYILGEFYAHGFLVQQDMKKYVEFVEKASDLGYDPAMFALACMYADGVNVEKDAMRSLEYMQLAADSGNVDAARIMAERYHEGIGVRKDIEQAARLFSTAATYGDRVANYKMGQLYDQGQGVRKDDRAALLHFKMAAEEGDIDALTEVTARTFKVS